MHNTETLEMKNKLKTLPVFQASVLKMSFEQIFKEDQIYLDLLEMDEVYYYLIGGEVKKSFFKSLKRSAELDETNHAFMVWLSDWMEILIEESLHEDLEYYELASNCRDFKQILHEYIHTSDISYLSECSDR